MKKPVDRLENATVAMLRKFCIESGYGVRYLSERQKQELLKVIYEIDKKAGNRFVEWLARQ